MNSQSLQSHIDGLCTFFDSFASRRDQWRDQNIAYYRQLDREYRFLIPPGSSVLELGCGTGDLLAAVEPSQGLGIDISPNMIQLAREKHPHLQFQCASAETYDAKGKTFDYIVLSELLAYSYDILGLFKALRPLAHPRTRIIINYYSRLWHPLYKVLEFFGRKAVLPIHNWVTTEDVVNFLALAGYEVINHAPRVLLPLDVPLATDVVNRFASQLPILRWFCFTNFLVARLPSPPLENKPVVSVICPCRNEAGNIPEIVKRLPDMGAGTELVFVEGHSIDDTYERCLEVKQRHPGKDITVLRQTGKGKADAVHLGFAKAKGDVFMILDADMTVPPETLPTFYEALMSGAAEFVNGSRLVYTMEKRAMRFLNLLGNKFFSKAFTYLLEQPIKDTLCGTKVFTSQDYQRILETRRHFGDFDPFGDFELLFGAAKLKLRIRDLPVRYRERTYGTTQISRFRHGLILLRMSAIALVRLRYHK